MACRSRLFSVVRADPWRHRARPSRIIGILSDVYVDQQGRRVKIAELDECHVPVVDGEKGDGCGRCGLRVDDRRMIAYS